MSRQSNASQEEVLSSIVLELHVPDFDVARKFYSHLGFQVVWERRERVGYMVMRRAHAILNFYCGTSAVYEHSFFRRYPPEVPRGVGVEVVVPVEDVHGMYELVVRALDSGEMPGCVVEALTLKPWGKWDFRMTDPFGYYIRVCEPDNWLVC